MGSSEKQSGWGADPVTAIQMATLIRPGIWSARENGAVAPLSGRSVVLEDLEQIKLVQVYKTGSWRRRWES